MGDRPFMTINTSLIIIKKYGYWHFKKCPKDSYWENRR